MRSSGRRRGHYNGWRAAGVTLAPSGAQAIRLCRYGGLPALRLQASRLLTGANVKELTAEFDVLPALRPDHPATACPADFGSRVIAHLAYPDGQQVTIAVALTGCNYVTNGNLRRSAAGFGHPPAYGPRLLTELERLTAGEGPITTTGAVVARQRSPRSARISLTRSAEGICVLRSCDLSITAYIV